MKKTATTAALVALLALSACEEQGPVATTQDFEAARAAATARTPQPGQGQPKSTGAGNVQTASATQRTDYGVSAANYRYDPTGKRDPFRSFVKDKLREDVADVQSPLEQFELGQLSIAGVVWQADRRRALVLDPSGQTYVVKTGDRIGKNDGVVTEIGDSALVVLESYVDFHGDKTEKEIEMRIRQSTGG